MQLAAAVNCIYLQQLAAAVADGSRERLGWAKGPSPIEEDASGVEVVSGEHGGDSGMALLQMAMARVSGAP